MAMDSTSSPASPTKSAWTGNSVAILTSPEKAAASKVASGKSEAVDQQTKSPSQEQSSSGVSADGKLATQSSETSQDDVSASKPGLQRSASEGSIHSKAKPPPKSTSDMNIKSAWSLPQSNENSHTDLENSMWPSLNIAKMSIDEHRQKTGSKPHSSTNTIDHNKAKKEKKSAKVSRLNWVPVQIEIPSQHRNRERAPRRFPQEANENAGDSRPVRTSTSTVTRAPRKPAQTTQWKNKSRNPAHFENQPGAERTETAHKTQGVGHSQTKNSSYRGQANVQMNMWPGYVDPKSMGYGGPMYTSYAPNTAVYGAQVTAAIQYQIEYYFSEDNLSRDGYLKSQMDQNGWLPLRVIANFNRIRMLGGSWNSVLEAVANSTIVETDHYSFQEPMIRVRVNWQKWVQTAPTTDSSVNNESISPSQFSEARRPVTTMS